MSAPSDRVFPALLSLGGRLKRVRLNANLTQRELADKAAVSLKTISNAEDGKNISTETLARLLGALSRLDELDGLFEDDGPSPVELARRRGRERQRASGQRAERDDDGGWQW